MQIFTVVVERCTIYTVNAVDAERAVDLALGWAEIDSRADESLSEDDSQTLGHRVYKGDAFVPTVGSEEE